MKTGLHFLSMLSVASAFGPSFLGTKLSNGWAEIKLLSLSRRRRSFWSLVVGKSEFDTTGNMAYQRIPMEIVYSCRSPFQILSCSCSNADALFYCLFSVCRDLPLLHVWIWSTPSFWSDMASRHGTMKIDSLDGMIVHWVKRGSKKHTMVLCCWRKLDIHLMLRILPLFSVQSRPSGLFLKKCIWCTFQSWIPTDWMKGITEVRKFFSQFSVLSVCCIYIGLS